jgi:hypothetical protein
MGGGRAAPLLASLRAQKDECAQRTGAHARPKPTSNYIDTKAKCRHLLSVQYGILYKKIVQA